MVSIDIAKDRRFVRAPFSRPVHRVARIDNPSFLERPDKQARFSTWNAIVQEETVVIVQPFSFSILQSLIRAQCHIGVVRAARNLTWTEAALGK